MNKKIIYRAIIFLLCFIIFYLLVAFCTLHIDFRLWGKETRVLFCLLQIFSVLISVGPYDI